MNTLYDLVKKIDALTANSQQVLNALIRSCVASGSSSGYKVNKYGVAIELDRADIYHLYDFYQSWEAAGFPSDEGTFNSLLARADERWRANASDTSRLASEAVAKHAQILYLTKEQAANMVGSGSETVSQADTDYWVAKIRESASPKGTVSSAPIPLNLRTPLYDENLSVKSFSQFETYLFPMGYHRADILGTPGNGEDYIAGGRDWTIDATEFLTLGGNHIVMGINSNPANKLESYEGKYTSLSWGNECYAFGNNSLAAGNHSIAQGDGAIVFGHSCYGQGSNSFIAGGRRDNTVKDYGFAANWRNTAVAKSSFVANYYNYAGGWGYEFTFIGSESKVVRTDCNFEYLESEDVCISNKSVAEVTGDSSLYKVIRISADEVDSARLPFDLNKDDEIVLYNLFTENEQGDQCQAFDIDGYAATPHVTRITNVTRVNKEGTDVLDYYEITLAKSVPVTSKYGLFAGGTVSLSTRSVRLHDIDGNDAALKNAGIGESSAVFGHGNAAIGQNQMVVGQMSVPNMDAKFVVGTGSAYIKDDDSYRANSLVIADTYSYMKLANGKSYIGMSTGTRDVTDMGPGLTDRVTLYRGTVMTTNDPDTGASLAVTTDTTQAFLYAARDGQPVARMGAGVHMNPYFSSDYPTSVMQSLQGTAILTSGAYIESTKDGVTTRLSLVDTLLQDSPVIKTADEHGIGIYAEDGIDIRNVNTLRGINIDTCSYITMTFKGLILNGNTFGALPVAAQSLSFALDKKAGSDNNGHLDSILYGHTTGASGFYYIDGVESSSKLCPSDDDREAGVAAKYDNQILHLLNSVQKSATDDKYHVASLSIPENTTNGSEKGMLRPKVTTGTIDGIGGDEGTIISSREIPYIDDVSVWSSAAASCFGYMQADTTGTLIAASDIHDSSFAYMPLLRFDPSTRKMVGDSHVFSTISVSTESGSPRYHAFKFKFYEDLTYFGEMKASASINGNAVDIYGEIRFKPGTSVLASSTMDGFRISFIPGFAIRSTAAKFGDPVSTPVSNLIYKKTNGLLVSNLSGQWIPNGTFDDEIFSTDPQVLFSGVAVQPGILAVDIIRKSTTPSVWNYDLPYRFHVRGLVPFEASSECIGMNITENWNKAMAACYSGKRICTPSELRTILEET